jgi:hypothetical protein
MLLVASSVGQAMPSKLEDGAMEFFSSVNSVHAQLMLNSILENARLQVSVSPALATLRPQTQFFTESYIIYNVPYLYCIFSNVIY